MINCSIHKLQIQVVIYPWVWVIINYGTLHFIISLIIGMWFIVLCEMWFKLPLTFLLQISENSIKITKVFLKDTKVNVKSYFPHHYWLSSTQSSQPHPIHDVLCWHKWRDTWCDVMWCDGGESSSMCLM